MTAPISSLKIFNIAHKMVLMAFFFTLPACDLYEESWATPNRMQVEQNAFFEMHDLQDVNASLVAGIDRYYDKHGGDGIKLDVTYDPASKTFGTMQAASEAARIVGLFRERGMKTAGVGVLPSPNQPQKLFVSFNSYFAKAPDDCTTLPGIDGSKGLERNDEYRLGCSVETMMARQIARPRDLMGRSNMPETTDGRRVGNSTDVYRDGVPNEPLEGETASGDE